MKKTIVFVLLGVLPSAVFALQSADNLQVQQKSQAVSSALEKAVCQ